MMHAGYPGVMAPAYGHPQPPGYGDQCGLVQNMAIWGRDNNTIYYFPDLHLIHLIVYNLDVVDLVL